MRALEARLIGIESLAGFTRLDPTRQRELLEEVFLRGGGYQSRAAFYSLFIFNNLRTPAPR